MASFPVLASLMSTQYPDIKTYDPLDVERLRGSRTQNQTALLALEDLKRQQQAEAAYRQAVQQNPGLLFGGGGQQPLLAQLSPGALPQTDGPPGAITQQAFGPSGPGATQTIPAPMDLSRFATGTPPPGGPVLASVGQPQGPVGGAQEVLFNLARQNPDAAVLLQRGMQQQEDMGYKRQEQGLKMREKVAESFGQLLGGAHDQASYDVIRRQLAQVSPEWAAALPQTYSAEGVQPFIDAAISAKDRATLGIAQTQAQADLVKARMSGRVAKTDQYLKAIGVTPGQETDADMRRALNMQTEDEMRVQGAHGAQAATQRALGETMQKRLDAFDKAGLAGQETHTVLDEIERLIAQGVYGNAFLDKANMAAYNAGLAQGDPKAQRTKRVMELGAQLKLAHGSLGTGVSTADAETYGKAAGNFEQPKNLQEMQESIKSMRRIGNTAMQRANEARRSVRETGELPAFEVRGEGTQAPPPAAPPRTSGPGAPAPSGARTSQAQPGAKVISRAALHAEAQRRNVSPEQAEQMARQKGYTVQ